MKLRKLVIFVIAGFIFLSGCNTDTSKRNDSFDEKNEVVDREDSEESGNSIFYQKQTKMNIGDTVTLDRVNTYIQTRDHYEIYAMKTLDKDEFIIMSLGEGDEAYVDIGFDFGEEGDVRMYPKSREFMIDLNRQQLVLFTDSTPPEHFSIAFDLTYFAPLVLSSDGKTWHLTSEHDCNAREMLQESLVSGDFPDVADMKSEEITINGRSVDSIPNKSEAGDTEYGIYNAETEMMESCRWAFIHTGNDRPITIEGKTFSAQVETARVFFGYQKEDQLNYNLKKTEDGYILYDIKSQPALVEDLINHCVVADEEDWYSRLMIGDASVLGFLP